MLGPHQEPRVSKGVLRLRVSLSAAMPAVLVDAPAHLTTMVMMVSSSTFSLVINALTPTVHAPGAAEYVYENTAYPNES